MAEYTFRSANGVNIRLRIDGKSDSMKVSCWKQQLKISAVFNAINSALHLEELKTKKARTVELTLDQGVITFTGNLNKAINLLHKEQGVSGDIYEKIRTKIIDAQIKELDEKIEEEEQQEGKTLGF